MIAVIQESVGGVGGIEGVDVRALRLFREQTAMAW
jgi:hypothetical protein